MIEVTEHALVEDYTRLETLVPLRTRGTRLAIDDMGSGFSTFSRVLELAPDILKLDRSLVSGLDHDPPRQAMAAALVQFARTTGATVVAEGVETALEMAELLALGVDCAQGYYLGRPAPLGEVPPISCSSGPARPAPRRTWRAAHAATYQSRSRCRPGVRLWFASPRIAPAQRR